MMTKDLPKHYAIAAIGFGSAGAAIYMLMINVTLAHIEAISALPPFDMRPFGYGPQGASQLLDALGEVGRDYYLTRQIPLDTLYPALLAATLVSIISWVGLRLPNSKLTRAGITFSVGAALFDYAENLGVVVMILSWPALPNALVYATSAASISKACMTVAALSTLLFLGGIWIRQPKT
ncbi:MAG: hypothetical protein ACI9KK_000706 [Ascidiaceihabitans sp.]|jgi:hypothetical protein